MSGVEVEEYEEEDEESGEDVEEEEPVDFGDEYDYEMRLEWRASALCHKRCYEMTNFSERDWLASGGATAIGHAEDDDDEEEEEGDIFDLTWVFPSSHFLERRTRRSWRRSWRGRRRR